MALLFYSIREINEIATVAYIPYAGAEDDAALNAGVERIKGDARAQSYARRFYQTTGQLRRLVVTLQNAFQHELNYRELVPRGCHFVPHRNTMVTAISRRQKFGMPLAK